MSENRRVVVISGAAKRLGAAMAQTLAAAGWNVVINFRTSQAEAEATKRSLVDDGGRALCVAGDLSQPADVDNLLQRTLAHFGRVDAFIANASTFRRTPLASLSAADWSEAIQNNLMVAALPATTFGRWLKEHDGGAMILLADSAAERPWVDYLPYSVGKAGVVALTRGLAKALAPQVRVNAIAPGPMLFPEDFDAQTRKREVQRTLLKRAGHPAHIAEAARFLLEHDYITGAVLPVDGGRGLV